jgi:hypothetical protein
MTENKRIREIRQEQSKGRGEDDDQYRKGNNDNRISSSMSCYNILDTPLSTVIGKYIALYYSSSLSLRIKGKTNR